MIYIIRCVKCLKLYVGETKQTLKQRITQHISSIKQQTGTPVSQHFNSPGHNLNDFSFFGLQSNNGWSDSKRKNVENFWIAKLNTLSLFGLNKDLNNYPTKYITLPFKGPNSTPNSLRQYLGENIKPCFTTGSPLKVTFNHKHRIASQAELLGLTPPLGIYTQ